MKTTKTRVLKLGRVASTARVNSEIARDPEYSVFIYESLRRHRNCDWGDLGADDKELNEISMIEGKEERIMSRYDYEPDHSKNICIITDWDRSATTILFSIEY